MTTIVKVQRSLEHGPITWLLYSRGHKNVQELPDALMPEYVKEAMGSDNKGYFVGAWSSIVGWGLSERVSDDQDF